jgi:hypothetical protein
MNDQNDKEARVGQVVTHIRTQAPGPNQNDLRLNLYG